MELESARFAAFCTENGIACTENEPMSAYTSFRIGGPAAVLSQPSTPQQVCAAMRFCTESGLTPLIIGNGSDLLVSDNGVSRPVIQLGAALSGMELAPDGRIRCQAGASLAALCVFAQKNGLTGLEFAYGIPGNVGGAVYMNAGAYGGEMKDVVESVTYATPEGELAVLPAAACDFSYRHSAFAENGGCIVEVTVALAEGDKEQIRTRMEELMGRRREKQPLEYPSAGSTFKRPVGGYASALIDECGLKGLRVGGAMVSEKHAGFLINYENATCADVLALVEQVQRIVREKTGFSLECEIKYVE